jgi:hypothetical protein
LDDGDDGDDGSAGGEDAVALVYSQKNPTFVIKRLAWI